MPLYEPVTDQSSGTLWRCAGASVAGSNHIARGVECQDAIAASAWPTVSRDDVLVMVASDGAGAATYGRTGADVITHQLTIYARRHLLYGGEIHDLTLDTVMQWLVQVRITLDTCSRKTTGRLADYAATLSVAIIGHTHAAFFQIGDGAIVVALESSPWQYGWVFWPDRGEYANTTYFLTDRDFASNLHFEMLKISVAEVSIFTDGLQDLLLSYQTHQVHQPFFRKIFLPLRNKGLLEEELNGELANYLQSQLISTRTNDDTSLMLASRL